MKDKTLALIIFTAFVLLTTISLLVSIKIGLLVFTAGVLIAVVFLNPFIGLLLYLAMTYLRPQEFVASLKGKPLMLAMALVVLIILVIHNAFQRKKFLFLNFRQGIYMIAFFTVIILSQLQLLYLTGAKEAFNHFLPVFTLFFMIVNLVRNLDELKKTFMLLAMMTLLISIDGIWQYYHGIDIAGQTPVEGRIRWIGIFSDPNDLGLTILAFTPFALLQLFRKKAKAATRMFWFLVLVILLYALYLTNSRGTFLGLIAVLAFFSIRKWGWAKGLVGGAVSAAAIFVTGPSRLGELSLHEASASGRIEAWATGIDLLKWRPILGVGYGNFTEYHPLTAHNSVVLCFSELGVVGLFVWMLIIVTSFTEMQRAWKAARGTELAVYAETMQLAIIGFFISAFFLSRTYNEVLYIIVALCSLLSYFTRKLYKYRVPFIDMNTVLLTIGAMIAAIAVVKVMVMAG